MRRSLALSFGLLWSIPGLLGGQTPLPSIAPVGAPNPDPIVRLTNTTYVVTFTITNLNGGGDGSIDSQCLVSGNVTFVSCQPLTFLAEDQIIARTVTFTTTGTAGAGAITYRVRTSNPVGPWIEGTWNETIVAPAGTVTPDAQPLMLGPNLGGQNAGVHGRQYQHRADHLHPRVRLPKSRRDVLLP